MNIRTGSQLGFPGVLMRINIKYLKRPQNNNKKIKQKNLFFSFMIVIVSVFQDKQCQ